MASQSRTLARAGSLIPGPARILKNITNELGMTGYRQVPLSQPLPDAPQPVPTTYPEIKTEISKLANGVTVASRQTFDAISCVGFLVKAGSRYLDPQISGIAHYMETNTFKETGNRTVLDTMRTLGGMGAQHSVQAFRDCTLYTVEVFPDDAEIALDVLADVTQNPTLNPVKVADAQNPYMWMRGDALQNPESEVPELMHQAAYGSNGLGAPFFLDENTINNVTSESIRNYYDTFYTPDRIVVTGTAIEHDRLVDLAQKYFGELKGGETIAQEKASYVGGELRYKNAMDGNQHVAVVFEGESWNSPDLMAMCTLNMMMGGGGSFSAGGPGKGMYTRLYQEVLGQYGWVNHASCSHSIFDDSSIFALYGFTKPSYAKNLADVLVQQATQMADRTPSDEELNRAKNSLASNIAFEFEHRQILFEDIGRQVMMWGEHREPSYWQNLINKVTSADVQRVAKKMLGGKPTLLNVGPEFSNAPNYDEVCKQLKR